MKIFTWFGPTAPENARGIARIQIMSEHTRPEDRRPEWHPVIFHAADEASAAARALSWWEAEVAKAEARVERGKRLAASRKAAA